MKTVLVRSDKKSIIADRRDTCTCMIVTNSDPAIVEKKVMTLLGKNHPTGIAIPTLDDIFATRYLN